MIRLRGATLHGLRDVDLDIPEGQLVVLTGVSGSGKTSLAFDTLHAESVRRFVETLSPSARRRIGALPAPPFRLLTGLPPSIGLSQRGRLSTHSRANVANESGLEDLLALLYGTHGIAGCPGCGRSLPVFTLDGVVAALMNLPAGQRLVLRAPVLRRAVGGLGSSLDRLRRQGVARVEVDGEAALIDEVPAVDARKPHDLDAVVDRIKSGPDRAERLADAVQAAWAIGDGRLIVRIEADDRHFHAVPWCPDCDRRLPTPTPPSLSPSRRSGWCPACHGHGVVRSLEVSRLIQDSSRSLDGGALVGWTRAVGRRLAPALERLGVPTDVPWSALSDDQRRLVLEGGPGLPGQRERAEARLHTRVGRSLLVERVCPRCDGERLGEGGRWVRLSARAGGGEGEPVPGPRLPGLLAETVSAARGWLARLQSGGELLDRELQRRLDLLERAGLAYLPLDRAARSLSGGEARRVRLAAAASSGVGGVLYVLDEPTAGLHPAEAARLGEVVEALRSGGDTSPDAGENPDKIRGEPGRHGHNTVIVVEHDRVLLERADRVIDFGPGAGPDGGKVVYDGPPSGLALADTPTGRWWSGREHILPRPSPASNRALFLRNATGHNLQGISVRFPLGQLVGVTGRSGSGKSSLVLDTLAVALSRRLGGASAAPLPHDGLDGVELLQRVVVGEAVSGRSIVAAVAGIWAPLRELWAGTSLARERGLTAEALSLARAGTRCEACRGEGIERFPLEILPPVVVPCGTCGGSRYQKSAAELRFLGISLPELLDMPLHTLRGRLVRHRRLSRVLDRLDQLGLGHLSLGRNEATLSGGERQRLRLGRELGRPGLVAGSLYVLDEPSVGLHPADLARLVDTLRCIIDEGGSVILVDHEPRLLSVMDHLIELGPGPGAEGGRLVAEGAPAALQNDPRSLIGPYLRGAPA